MHGRPRRLVYNDSAGSIQELSNRLASITDNASLNEGKAANDAVTTNGGQFNQGSYTPLTVSTIWQSEV